MIYWNGFFNRLKYLIRILKVLCVDNSVFYVFLFVYMLGLNLLSWFFVSNKIENIIG